MGSLRAIDNSVLAILDLTIILLSLKPRLAAPSQHPTLQLLSLALLPPR